MHRSVNPLIIVTLLCVAGVLDAAEFYVAPAGSAAGDGSLARPWDLQTALAQPPALKPGDTLWLRGGVHRQFNRPTLFSSDLCGQPNLPITVRQYPGERATVDGSLTHQSGGWTIYWGFEIMNSFPARVTAETGALPRVFRVNYSGQTVDLNSSAVSLKAPNIKLINLVIHDGINGGIACGLNAVNAEIYGVLSYYNGWQGGDRGHGHGLEGQNQEPSVKVIQESLFFANYGLGAQVTATAPVVDNFHFEGNVFFLNGILARRRQGNFLLGPWQGQAKNAVFIGNFIYDTDGGNADANIGYTGGAANPVVLSNCFHTTVLFSANNQDLVLAGNTFLGGTIGLNPRSYPDNFYSSTPPRKNLVELRPNKYEPGRAHIIVCNWENLEAAPVDVSPVLRAGAPFEVRNAQDYFGAPVLAGIYDGGLLQLPMTGLTVAPPVGAAAPPSTAPAFNVFVLVPSPPPLNTSALPPALPVIPNPAAALGPDSAAASK